MAKVLPLSVSDLKILLGQRYLLNIDFLSVEHGDFLCVVGPNGAGKSLLLKSMAGLQPEQLASIKWGGATPRRESYGQLGVLLQNPVLLRRTVSANIHFALKAQGIPRNERKLAVQAALELAAMEHLSEAAAQTLSGGEQQRLALVRALACKPELLLLDEPTANMDPSSTAWFESTLLQAFAKGVSVLMVTHDLHQAKRLASRVVLMHRGKIIEDTDKELFFTNPMSAEAKAFIGGELLF